MPSSTVRRSRKERPVWAEAIRLRRLQLDLKQEDVEALSGDLITQSTISNIEMGKINPSTITASRLGGLLQALRWTPQEFTEATAIDLPGFSTAPAIPPNASQAIADGPQALHYGPVSAGILGHQPPPKPRLVNIPSWLAAKYDPKDIFVLTVEGHSMTCDDIRKSIPEGSEVYFHRSLQPMEGEVIAVWLEDRDFGVIKVYKPKRETTVLQSYNFKHPPILIDERNPAIIQGVYVGKSDPSPLRFDR